MPKHRVYTRTGDEGDTGLFGGGRVPKSHPRVDAYGDVDELNAIIGWALTRVEDDAIREKLASVQPELFSVGAHLATPPPQPDRKAPRLPPLPEGRAEAFEQWIDAAHEELPALDSFVLPGGSPGGAALHLARTVCRRAERGAVALAGDEEIDPEILVYLNRLSDLLFVLARLENRRADAEEVRWRTRSE